MNARIDALFERTKLLCFGLYVLTAPADSRLSFGRDFPTLPNQAMKIDQIMQAEKAKILAGHPTAEVTYFGKGPAPNTWVIRSYDDKFAKGLGLEGFDIYYVVGPHIFVDSNATAKSRNLTEDSILKDVVETAKNLRLRAPDEVPTEPGLCHEFGFTRKSGPDAWAISQAGLHMAALPDVVFSVSVNPGQRTTGSEGLSLLQRIAKQKRDAGQDYPKLTTLREGKKNVHGWDGEESLTRRADGSHDFRWLFIGQSKNIARPAYMSVTLFSKVEADRIGAAAKASITDAEAVALWDKLLDGLKFRVAVPGAPAEAVALKTSGGSGKEGADAR